MKTYIFCISLIASLSLLQIIKCDSNEPEYHVTNITTEISESKETFFKLWNTQQTEYAKEMADGFKLYEEIKKQQQILAELHYSTGNYQKERSIHKMASILSGNRSRFQQEEFYETYDYLTKYFDENIIEEILNLAIESVYSEKSPDLFLEQLASIWQTSGDNDSKYFEVMIKTQMILYEFYSEHKQKPHPEYLQKLAVLLQKIKNHDMYTTLKPNLKYRISNAIESVPNNLKYILFKSDFCMKNAKHDEFIYTAIHSNVNPYSRYIWLWWDTRCIDTTGHIQAEVIENDLNGLKITLRGTTYNVYYYLMTESLMIAGLESCKEPFNHVWNVQLVSDNKIVLSQNGYIICSDARYDSSRRSVFGYKDVEGYDADRLSCQWIIGSCSKN